MSFLGTPEELASAASEMGMSRQFCSVMGDPDEFQWIATQPLWKWIWENITDVHQLYMAYV